MGSVFSEGEIPTGAQTYSCVALGSAFRPGYGLTSKLIGNLQSRSSIRLYDNSCCQNSGHLGILGPGPGGPKPQMTPIHVYVYVYV